MKKKIFIISIISLLMDQITKMIVESNLDYGEAIKVINNFFYITRSSNTGAAFSILEGKSILLLIVGFVTIFFLIKYIDSFKNKFLPCISFGLLFGGILGNMSDRLFLSYVRDFLKFNIFGYNFPIFNVADMCIVIGAFLLVISIYRGDEV